MVVTDQADIMDSFTFGAHDGWSLRQVIEEYVVLGYVAVIDGDKTARFLRCAGHPRTHHQRTETTMVVTREDKTVRMQYVATANVLPEYVSAYLDEGWTIVPTATPAPADASAQQSPTVYG